MRTSQKRDTKEFHTHSSAMRRAERKYIGAIKLQLPEGPRKLRRTRVQILLQ